MTPADLRKLIEAASPAPWSCWDGFGPDKFGMMRAERIGPNDSKSGLWSGEAPGHHPIAGRKEDFEVVVALRNLAPLLIAAWEVAEDAEPHFGCACAELHLLDAYRAERAKLEGGLS